jgi:C1A family cysteine protease
LEGVLPLSDKIPKWPELAIWTAQVAENANKMDVATDYYHRALSVLAPSEKEQIAFAMARLAILEQSEKSTGEITSVAAAATTQIKNGVDYSKDFKVVRDQGQEGSSVGQSIAALMDYEIMKSRGETVQISARHIYYLGRKGSKFDTGAVVADTIEAITKQGTVEESVWPYRPGEFDTTPPAEVQTARRFKIFSPTRADKLRDLKSLLANGPVVASLTLYQSSFNDGTNNSGLLPMPLPHDKINGTHPVVFVGYDDARKVYKFLNSWGTSWGDHGFGYVPYDYLLSGENVLEAWSFQVSESPAKA